jgi:UDP-N-acetylglucosamine--N-acetylmuramyl-(pentapeptide) pyrophosphoryl-undecaprenol N-acetylglucosamine transferase
MKQLKRVLIMAGGTGGHVFPGLALATFLRAQGVEVHWLGTSLGLEARLVPEANLPLHTISITGLRGKNLKTLLSAPFRIIYAIHQAIKVLRQVQPDLVIGMGGFVSGPGGLASWLTNCPLIIHEQNAIAGFTNKQLARFAKRVLEGFPQAFKPQAKVQVVGNPVRQELESVAPPEKRFLSPRKPFRLLVIGGSLGAQALNDILPRALATLPKDLRPEVWHQTGEKHFAATKNAYETMQIQANLVPFVKDMAQAYAWADIIVCRAGALTIAELCAVGLGAILVPFPHAVDDHQTANASFLVTHGAALCIQQAELTDLRLAAIVQDFAAKPERCLTMAQAAYALRNTQVVKKIYDICEEVCH